MRKYPKAHLSARRAQNENYIGNCSAVNSRKRGGTPEGRAGRLTIEKRNTKPHTPPGCERLRPAANEAKRNGGQGAKRAPPRQVCPLQNSCSGGKGRQPGRAERLIAIAARNAQIPKSRRNSAKIRASRKKCRKWSLTTCNAVRYKWLNATNV